MNSKKLERNDRIKKIIKYLLFGFIIGISVRYIPTSTIKDHEILMILIIGSIGFGIIDMVAPSIVIQN